MLPCSATIYAACSAAEAQRPTDTEALREKNKLYIQKQSREIQYHFGSIVHTYVMFYISVEDW